MPYSVRQSEELNRAKERLRDQQRVPEICANGTLLSLTTIDDDRGRGYRAACDIPRGTRLLGEKPLLWLADCHEPLSQANIAEIQRLVGRLSGTQQQEFQSLFHPRGQQPTPEGRFDYNKFEMSDTECAVFSQASFLNHSCVPNAQCTWNKGLGLFTTYSIHDIYRGEEVCINYLPNSCYKTRNQRQTELQREYEFECECPACESTEMGQASQANRTRMKKLYEAIQRNKNKLEWAQRDRQLNNILDLQTKLWKEKMMDREELASAYREGAMFLKREGGLQEKILSFSSIRELALKAAREELSLHVMATGIDSEEVRNCLNFILSLE